MNRKNKIWWIVEWAVVLIAYGYIIYRLFYFNNYESVILSLKNKNWYNWLCGFGCIVLMPLNVLLEGCKWRELLRGISTISYKEAVRQVLYGMAGAFITPYRVGDIPARVWMLQDKKHWKAAIGLGAIGGIVQTAVIIVIGIVPAWIFLQEQANPYIGWLIATVGVLIGLLILTHKIPVFASMQLASSQIAYTILWSVLRYVCWLVQFFLMMQWANMSLSLSNFVIALPAYYLFVTITPNIPIADAGIRGGWAIYVFGQFGVAEPVAAIVALSMWGVNTLLPMLCYIPFYGTSVFSYKQDNTTHKHIEQ